MNPAGRLAVLAALFLSAAAPAAPVSGQTSTLFSGATLIDGTGGPARSDVDILVQGERIVALGARGTLAGTAESRRIELTDRFVIPGLIDSHVHLATPPVRHVVEAILRRDLYGGVTAVRDMADDIRMIAETAREARFGEIPAPDIAYAALMAGPSFFADPRVAAASSGMPPGTAPWMQAIEPATNLPLAIARAKGTGASAIKIYADLSPEMVDALTAEAHRQGMLVWAHAAIFPARPADVIEAGVDSVSHVCYLAYQREIAIPSSYEDRAPVTESLLSFPDDPIVASLFRAMLRRGTILDATGSLFVRNDAARKERPSLRSLRCSGSATAKLAAQAWRMGVPISAGTDRVADARDQWPEVYAELEFLANDVGMPPLQVIRAATLTGARAMGLDRDMGTVEPGKLANFVVLARNPTGNINNVRSIVATVKRGRIYRRSDYRSVTPAELGS